MAAPRRFALALTAALVMAAAARADEVPPAPPTPACGAPDGAATVERIYQTMTLSPFETGVLKIGPITDHGVFPPGPNPYATKEMFVKEVRYCEADVTLPDGTVDPTYWMIQTTFNIRSWLTPTTGCSLKRDVFQNGCALYRPKRAETPKP